MTPITKNVIVADQNGNIIGMTYPKRAKGLIKKGRAYYNSEGILCMVCSAVKTEDYAMSDKLNEREILDRIDKLNESLENLSDILDKADSANAAADMVEMRENTNHEIIELLQKMYDDIVEEKERRIERFNAVADKYKELYPQGLSHEAEETLNALAREIV